MGDEAREACGLVGVICSENAVPPAYYGLFALQHRGQESAGIVSCDGREFHSHKGMGLVSQVFTPEDLQALESPTAIGHTRYSTTGSSRIENAQPLMARYAKGEVAVAHNGNLVNGKALREHLEGFGSIFQTSCDSEVILHLLAKPSDLSFEDDLLECLGKLRGAFSLVLLTRELLIGVRDPWGFRPLALGRLPKGHMLASESCAFGLVGAEYVRSVEPGEVVFITMDRMWSRHLPPAKRLARCIFEPIYFSRPDSRIFQQSVHRFRKALGHQLAREAPVDADIVVPIPDSGNSAGLGFSEESGTPCEQGFVRSHYVGRTFIEPTQLARERGVEIKLSVIRDAVCGKRVVVVDDSLIRGTTSRGRVHVLREAGATEVHLRIACPPHRHPCFYGIDFPDPHELLANRMGLEEMQRYLGLDSLAYLSMEGMLDAAGLGDGAFCTACFSGDYPVEVAGSMRKEMLE